ncbi:MAG: transposase [Alphaproteobacteria bacterium]|nr:transposase [Alphaproteobacteria bacterium]MBP9776616.1 transposase [Alphaproteobacteria bacterium]
MIGTHHGIESKYLSQYLAEYTFRFNRCHDPDSFF